MHVHLMRILALIATVLLLAACQQPEGLPRDGERHVGDGRYDGPPVTVDVLVQRYLDPVEYIAVVEITAPTGGWEATLDHAEVVAKDEDDRGIARLYITLEGPGGDEFVTQALVPHHHTFRTEEPFEQATVFIRHHRRGEPVGQYRLAATGHRHPSIR